RKYKQKVNFCYITVAGKKATHALKATKIFARNACVFKRSLLYSFDKCKRSSTLKNNDKTMATMVARPMPVNSTLPRWIEAPLIPITSTTHVRIKFCEFA